MKITFLGTAAAEGVPAVWCNCPLCTEARKNGGKDIRTRSQVMIDDCLLIDFPMDTYMHAITNKLSLSNVGAVFISHAHMDHCYPQEFSLRGLPFAHKMKCKTVTVHGDETVISALEREVPKKLREGISKSVVTRVLHPYDSVTASGGYTVTALPAMHTKGEECLIYAISDGKKTALIFNDSGILPLSTYEKVASLGLKFDLVSFDCTYGYARRGEGRHMGALDADGERKKMQKCGLLKESTKYVLTHFSHNGKLNHEKLCKKTEKLNFIVAYDGMGIEV